MSRRIHRPSPALLVSALALVVASSGAGYAAGMIGTAQIKNGAVTSAKIKDQTILVRDVAPAARTALRGPRAYTLVKPNPLSLDAARTRNVVSVVRPSTGIYCLDLVAGVDASTVPASVTVEYGSSAGGSLAAYW